MARTASSCITVCGASCRVALPSSSTARPKLTRRFVVRALVLAASPCSTEQYLLLASPRAPPVMSRAYVSLQYAQVLVRGERAALSCSRKRARCCVWQPLVQKVLLVFEVSNAIPQPSHCTVCSSTLGLATGLCYSLECCGWCVLTQSTFKYITIMEFIDCQCQVKSRMCS